MNTLFPEPFPKTLRHIPSKLQLGIQIFPPAKVADNGPSGQRVIVGVSIPSLSYVEAVVRSGSVEELGALVHQNLTEFGERLQAAKRPAKPAAAATAQDGARVIEPDRDPADDGRGNDALTAAAAVADTPSTGPASSGATVAAPQSVSGPAKRTLFDE